MFVTIETLKVADMKEEQVSLLIGHELAHYLLDHQPLRLLKWLMVTHVVNKLFVMPNKHSLHEPVVQDFKDKTYLHSFSCFYP